MPAARAEAAVETVCSARARGRRVSGTRRGRGGSQRRKELTHVIDEVGDEGGEDEEHGQAEQ